MESTRELVRLRSEVKAWLETKIPKDVELPTPGHDLGEFWVQWTLNFRKELGAKGWLAPNWPTYLGGGGYSPAASQVIMDELRKRQLPPLGIHGTWTTTLRVWGTEEQKGRWLPPTLQGEIIVNQIVSEPNGGTDLATKATTAVRDGDEYIINGEKGYIGALLPPDYLFILLTMDVNGPRYENLGMVIVDAHDPGVSISHRTTLMGLTQSSFTLNDVRVDPEDIVGGERGGWHVAQTLLDVERGGNGVTLEESRDVEKREREYWTKQAP